MARSSNDFSYSSGGDNSSDENYIPSEGERGGQVRSGRRGRSANRILERGVQMRGAGGVRTRGGIRMEGIQARRRRRTDVIISGSGFTSIQADDLSGNSFTTYVEEAGAEEEGRRGQVRGRRRGRPRGLGRERVRRHVEEEEEAATILTSMPGFGNSFATNYNGRPSLENSCATNPQERPEIGNSQATNCIGVGHTLVQPQINEGGTRGGVRTRGGIRMEGIQARRCRRTDVIISGSGFTSIQADDLSGNSFTTYVEEAGAEEEGRRGQVRGRRRPRPRGLGRERVRRHVEEEEEAATIVTSRPGFGNSFATNYNGRPSLENSCATNPQERPEIGNSQVTNCIGVGHTLVQPQINEGGTRIGSIAIPNSQGRPENDNPQATNCTGVGSAFVQPEINEGRIRSGNIAIPNSPERPEIGNSPATNCTGVASGLVQPEINEGRIRSGNIATPNSPERPEIGNFPATNCTGVASGLVRPQSNEGGTMSGNIAIPNFLERPKIGNSQTTNCTRVGSALVQLQINDGGTRSGNIAIFDDTNMLECHLCSKTLSIPVSQCVNGHIACASCCENHQNNCPTCGFRVDIPCLFIEELLRRLKITCLNSKYGCKEILSYSMKREHERSCTYEPCHCPVPGCGFDGSYKNLYRHFSCEHPDSATHFTFDSSFFVHMDANMKYKFLQADDNTLFILNYGVQALGYVANLICMGPGCLLGEYSYELEASCVNGSSVKITLPSTQSLPKWTVCLPVKSVLLVPKDLIDSSWDHKIQVCICKKGEK